MRQHPTNTKALIARNVNETSRLLDDPGLLLLNMPRAEIFELDASMRDHTDGLLRVGGMLDVILGHEVGLKSRRRRKGRAVLDCFRIAAYADR